MASKNLKQLFSKINREVEKVVHKDVSREVIEFAEKRVKEDVYDVYPHPKQYKRTYTLQNSFKVHPFDEGVAVYNSYYDGDKYIPEVVETGVGYDFVGFGYAYEQPRPFIANTRKYLRESGLHTLVLKNGLRGKGIEVE